MWTVMKLHRPAKTPDELDLPLSTLPSTRLLRPIIQIRVPLHRAVAAAPSLARFGNRRKAPAVVDGGAVFGADGTDAFFIERKIA